jgi:hypothetical protein
MRNDCDQAGTVSEQLERIIAQTGFSGLMFRLQKLLDEISSEGGENATHYRAAAERVKKCAVTVRDLLKGE